MNELQIEYNFSASDLIKRSCAQIVYLHNKQKQIYTDMMQNGTKYQEKIIDEEKIKNQVADELRGCYTYSNINEKFINKPILFHIFFCIDMLKNNEFYEIKSILDENGNNITTYPQWYFNNSLLQCAFYKSLLMNLDTDKLYTPKFRIKEGYKKQCIQINNNANYYLKFGDVGLYQIDVLNPEKIIEFYKNKINHIYFYDYDIARKFDYQFKWKEYDFLNQYFTYKKI